MEITPTDLLNALKKLCWHVDYVRYQLSCNRCGPSDLYKMEQEHYEAQQLIKQYEKQFNGVPSV